MTLFPYISLFESHCLRPNHRLDYQRSVIFKAHPHVWHVINGVTDYILNYCLSFRLVLCVSPTVGLLLVLVLLLFLVFL